MSRSSIKKLILCVCVFVICIVPAVYINTLYGYLPMIMAAILIGGSFGYLRLLKRSLTYEEHSDLANCVRGTKIDFSIELRNRSILFFPLVEPSFYIADLFGKDDSVLTDIVTLTPKERRSFEFDARFDHIGTYDAGLRSIRLQDLLGLFTDTIENRDRYTVNVTPQIYEIERMPISRSAVSESQKMTVVNPLDVSDYAGVREYVIGDPIKNIHWKLSARTTGYMTKVFESYANAGVCVIPDFHSPAYGTDELMDIFDCVVETALTVGTYAMKQGLETELKFYDKYGEKAQLTSFQRDDLNEMMERMPRIHTDPGYGRAVDLLREEGNSLYSQGNLVICTADLGPDLIETMISIKNRQKNPMLFAVIPDSVSDEQRQVMTAPFAALEASGIFFHVLSDASTLEGGDLT